MSETLQIDSFATQPFHQVPYLYKISSLYSSSFSEEFDQDFAPIPTSASELPELTSWSTKFAIGVLEIWAGKRPPSQLAKWCHSSVYASLLNSTSYQKEVGKLRKIYIHEPLDGLCESTATIRFSNRLRSMTMRFEGIDRRWICTNLELI
jgi:hypothetical protein